jgi:hypothetical protein
MCQFLSQYFEISDKKFKSKKRTVITDLKYGKLTKSALFPKKKDLKFLTSFKKFSKIL